MDIKEINAAVVELDAELTAKLVGQALKENYDPSIILEEGLIPGMKKVGELFARKEYFVPEVLIASEAFYAGFDQVIPLIKSVDRVSKGKIVIGVVEGDIHDIGKNIVRVMIEASGYQVVDLGKDVPVARFVEAAIKEKPQVMALSSLMTTTMMRMKDIINGLEKRRIRNDLRIIVGGAPVNEEFARSIGADGYGEDATEAIGLIDKLVSG